MQRFLKWLGLVFVGVIVLLLLLGWTPDTDRAEMIEKYSSTASQFVTDGDGMSIHYRDEGNKNGPAIVLLHGSSASLHTWEDMIRELSGEYRLISLDFPGHGLTGPDPKRDYSVGSLIDAAETVMDAVGVERAVIAGNSMGGWASWRMALASPERVTGLILIDASGPQIEEKTDLYLAAKIVESPIGQLLAPKITPRPIVRKTLTQVIYDDTQISETLMDRYWELNRFPGNRTAMVDRAKVDREPEYWNRVGNIDVPVLILWGDHDVTTPPAFGRAFDAAIENSKLITYPDAAHLPMEERPVKVAGDIRAWMGENFPPVTP